MNTHNICFYKELVKSTHTVIWRLSKWFDCLLIIAHRSVCAVVRLDTVCVFPGPLLEGDLRGNLFHRSIKFIDGLDSIKILTVLIIKFELRIILIMSD